MYTSSHGATIVKTKCTIVSQKCSSACYHGILCQNSTNRHHHDNLQQEVYMTTLYQRHSNPSLYLVSNAFGGIENSELKLELSSL